MTKLIFKPEMFASNGHPNNMSAENQCYRAQLIYDKWLRDNGVRVYNFEDDNTPWTTVKYRADTHQALLVCVEEIEKKCAHSELIVLKGDSLRYVCGNCDQEIKPTGWVEV